jgi:capsular polysaccharide export protein
MRIGLEQRGWSMIVITHLLSVWVCARKAGLRCVLTSHEKRSVIEPLLAPEKAQERLQDLTSTKAAIRFQGAVWKAFERLHRKYTIQAIGVWNGLFLGSQAQAAFAKANDIPTVFFEIGNIEPKLFIDPEGVNAESRVARDPKLLDQWVITDQEIAKWRHDFIERKVQSSSPPQARALRRINGWYPVDWIGANVMRIPQPFKLSLVKKIVSRIRICMIQKASDTKPTAPYIFLELQVSTDTNLLLFSDYDNLAAVAFAGTYAKAHKCRLIVKSHPVEPNLAFLRELRVLCLENNHLMTTYNTTKLILGAEEVITINSTVGLEAMLLNKKVTVLGKSLYGAFSNHQAAAYVLRYLVDFDPFGKTPISNGAIEQILSVISTSGNLPDASDSKT